jgi:hypothetical protein
MPGLRGNQWLQDEHVLEVEQTQIPLPEINLSSSDSIHLSSTLICF